MRISLIADLDSGERLYSTEVLAGDWIVTRPQVADAAKRLAAKLSEELMIPDTTKIDAEIKKEARRNGR